MKRVLLVYPQYPPNTYWSFAAAMPFIGRRASMPPLSLITVAAMLPSDWELRLVDMNIQPLRDDDLYWADMVFTSTMLVQAPSLDEVIRRARRIGVPVVAGGPHPSTTIDGIPGADHVLRGEAEDVLPAFLADLADGKARREYRTEGFPDLSTTPPPRFDLLDRDAYASMAVQYSRGCPFTCEFCDIWQLYGRRPRVKSTSQFLGELDRLHETGWRGAVFVVDDNFVGDPRRLRPFLERLATWQSDHGYPFDLFTEASVNLSHHPELIRGMRDAGFSMVFLGIETPSRESLAATNKHQNLRSDLLEAVRSIQQGGLEVSGGFIVGFDGDRQDIFDRQAAFIRAAAIPMAMVGVLTALPGTDLYRRLEREGRIQEACAGNNTHTFQANFRTGMPAEHLARGYRRLIDTVYDRRLRNYFRRCRDFLRRWGPTPRFHRPLRRKEIRALLLSLATVPRRPYGRQFLRFLGWTLLHRPGRFAEAVRLGVMGFHFRSITAGALGSESLREDARSALEDFRRRVREDAPANNAAVRRELQVRRRRVLRRFRRRIARLDPTFRPMAESDYATFLADLDDLLTDLAPAARPGPGGGRELLEEIRGFCRREEEVLASRYREVRERAGRSLDELQRGAWQLYREQRRRLRMARRRLGRLPREYRPIARREYAALRNSLGLMALEMPSDS